MFWLSWKIKVCSHILEPKHNLPKFLDYVDEKKFLIFVVSLKYGKLFQKKQSLSIKSQNDFLLLNIG